MFERRLTWFWILLTVLALVIVGRLTQIQVVQAGHYAELAERMLMRPVRYLPAARGTVFDRGGQPLLSDEPTFNVCLHYAVLAGEDEVYLRSIARARRRSGEYAADESLAAIVAELRQDIERTWARLGTLTGLSVADLRARGASACARVARVKAAVQRSNPTIRRIAEEDQLLPVLEGVDAGKALSVRLELEAHPWLRVTPGTQRVAHDADALAHVLGRLGEASPERIAEDPLRGDDLRRLRAGDRCGTSGVERLAETSLRGWAGRIVEDFDRSVIERTDPIAGQDVYLTIDLQLQRHVLELLEHAVEGDPSQDPPGGLPGTHRAGAAAVVLDVATRDVLALVSFPTYEYDYIGVDYDRLRRDTRRMPLMFRAVQAQYPPGSTCKVITLIGALSDAVVTPETRFHCTGHLLPDRPDRFRCWIYNQHGLTHDMVDNPAGQDGESAVRNSCNLYFFQVGQRLGPARLCEWFTRLGLGRPQGTGLVEESAGVVPTEAWLQEHQGRGYQAADAWNFAIGQGEVTTTPLQAANVAASVATGYWAPVRVAYDSTGRALGAPPTAVTPLDNQVLGVVRRGMWRVVNERGGTAPRARLDGEGYQMCGKTGSAQTPPRVLNSRYTCEWPDGRRQEVVATSEEEALEQLGDPPPKIVGRRANQLFPALEEGEGLPSHAWFIGYTQRATTGPSGQAVTGGKSYAVSVVIEFGGSGGRVAAPVAKEIAEHVLRATEDRK